jgi:hypothetical protein
MTAYSLDEFIDCCGKNPTKVFPINNVVKDAQNIFHLNTKSELLDFIGNGGLEEIEYLNTKPWENNPDKKSLIYVDAYQFKTMNILGYIAFFSNRGNWIIKSFHRSNEYNPIMEIALRKAGLIGIVL